MSSHIISSSFFHSESSSLKSEFSKGTDGLFYLFSAKIFICFLYFESGGITKLKKKIFLREKTFFCMKKFFFRQILLVPNFENLLYTIMEMFTRKLTITFLGVIGFKKSHHNLKAED